MECFSKGENLEVFDWVNEIQAAAVDWQWEWIDDLPLDKDQRDEVFKRVCLAASLITDALFDPIKCEKLIGPKE
ncbi:MAG TPA: hypothetical protein VG604_03365 [Candidatus Saccharimonadales bacterium]|nr:hypothetical protein [Candidatus Saccharimonadales bacterium]